MPERPDSKKLTNLRLRPSTRDWFERTQGNRYASIVYVVESWPELYRSTLSALRSAGCFLPDDARAMIVAMRDVELDPARAGQQMADAIDASSYSKKPRGANLQTALSQLPRVVLAVLEVWATAPAEDVEAHIALVVGP